MTPRFDRARPEPAAVQARIQAAAAAKRARKAAKRLRDQQRTDEGRVNARHFLRVLDAYRRQEPFTIETGPLRWVQL